MKRNRAPARIDVDFARLIAAVPGFAELDAGYLDRAFERTRAELVRSRDGTFTARVVWRKRTAIISAVTCTLRGVTLR